MNPMVDLVDVLKDIGTGKVTNSYAVMSVKRWLEKGLCDCDDVKIFAGHGGGMSGRKSGQKALISTDLALAVRLHPKKFFPRYSKTETAETETAETETAETETETTGKIIITAQRFAELQKCERFVNAVRATEDCVIIDILVRQLQQAECKISRSEIFSWLRENKYIEDVGVYHNIPTEKAIEENILAFREVTIEKNANKVHINFTPLITGWGQIKLFGIFENICRERSKKNENQNGEWLPY